MSAWRMAAATGIGRTMKDGVEASVRRSTSAGTTRSGTLSGCRARAGRRTASRANRNGSTRRGPGRRQLGLRVRVRVAPVTTQTLATGRASGRTDQYSRCRTTIATTATQKRRPWARSRPMPSASTTCWATCGSCSRTACRPTSRRVDCNLRLLRGGSWTNGPAEDARWLPVWTGTEYRIWTIGFRAARTLD